MKMNCDAIVTTWCLKIVTKYRLKAKMNQIISSSAETICQTPRHVNVSGAVTKRANQVASYILK
jgi:hypothetical protein